MPKQSQITTQILLMLVIKGFQYAKDNGIIGVLMHKGLILTKDSQRTLFHCRLLIHQRNEQEALVQPEHYANNNQALKV